MECIPHFGWGHSLALSIRVTHFFRIGQSGTLEYARVLGHARFELQTRLSTR